MKSVGSCSRPAKWAIVSFLLFDAGAARIVEAQSAVRGVVRSAAAGEALENVTVTASAGSALLGVTTSPSGAFIISVPSLPARLIATRLGFAPETLVVRDVRPVTFRLRTAALSLTPMVVQADRATSSASSSVVRALDITLRPRESSQELLRLVPGLVIAQHAGGGKAEQLYLRGFDADHGTDVAVSVDGIPVNMVTHAHGQGYADLHWLMPEVVDAIDVRKGPFDVRDGDFATAGAVTFRTKERVADPIVEVRGGSFDTRHAVALIPLGGDATTAGGYIAGSGHFSDGPFEAAQDYRRVNFFGRGSVPVNEHVEVIAVASAFDASWNASGQVPDRAVRSGLISRFGAIDSTEGGSTSRYDVSVAIRPRVSGHSAWEARAFATRYKFDLYSNFTYFLGDPVNGDGIQQIDDRYLYGGSAMYRRDVELANRPAQWSVGVETRLDAGDVALHRQRERTRLSTVVDAYNRQSQLAQWARLGLQVGSRVHLDLGLRADLFRFSVDDRLGEEPIDEIPHGSGTVWKAIVNPKVNVAIDVSSGMRVFAHAGTGFHSNDGRNVILATSGDRVLPRAASAELGARNTWAGGTAAMSLWGLDLESETVFVGDEGTTEASGRTRRVGVDIEARQRLTEWLWADADLNVSRGRFRDLPAGENLIPLAPVRTAAAGLTIRDAGPASGGLRVRHVASRAASENGAVRALGFTIWELHAEIHARNARFFATMDNLFGIVWNEAQFATTSRLPGETEGVTELHYTPGAPRSVQAGVGYRF